MRQSLRRRGTARKRIACDYQLKRIDAMPGLEVPDWLSVSIERE